MNFPLKSLKVPVIVFPLSNFQNPLANQWTGSQSITNLQGKQQRSLNEMQNTKSGITKRNISQLSLNYDKYIFQNCHLKKSISINLEDNSYFPRSQSIVEKNDITLLPNIKNLKQVRNEQKLSKLTAKQIYDQTNDPAVNSHITQCQPSIRQISQSFVENSIQCCQLYEEKTTSNFSLQKIEGKHEKTDFLSKYENKIDELFKVEDEKKYQKKNRQNQLGQPPHNPQISYQYQKINLKISSPQTTSSKSCKSTKCTFSEKLKRSWNCKRNTND